MSGQMTQREAVFIAIKNTLKAEFKENTKVILNEQHKTAVVEALSKDFQAKKIALKDSPTNQEKLKSPVLLKSYVTGLVNNWIKRDSRLNGTPKKPTPAQDAKPKMDQAAKAPVVAKPDVKIPADPKKS